MSMLKDLHSFYDSSDALVNKSLALKVDFREREKFFKNRLK